MAAHRNDITPHQKIQITVKLLAEPEENRSQLARDLELSRPTLYSILGTGQKALEKGFTPPTTPPNPSGEGFWLWVDANRLKRFVVHTRASCGGTLSSIQQLTAEAFDVRISEETLRQVIQESYQKAFEYRNHVDLSAVTRATFDEMYRWDRCVLTGVDADSLFIFLCEKQAVCSGDVWKKVMERLRDKQALSPSQSAVDGLSTLKASACAVWEGVRIVHDINHLRRSVEKVRAHFERLAYQAMARREKMGKRYLKGPTRRTSQEKLEALLEEVKVAERRAIDKSEQVSRWCQQAHEALNVIHPKTEKINVPSWSQSVLAGVAKKFEKLPGFYAKEASRYLKRLGQKIVEERAEFTRVMEGLSSSHEVPFGAVEKAAYLWELNKQYQAATWPGTKEKVGRTIVRVWQELQLQIGEGAFSLMGSLCLAFREVLAASSPVEWSHSQIGAVLSPQKRVSSGWLGLRVAYLNLTPFREGLRKGKSPHELLTGEGVQDWLTKLGYAPKEKEIRRFKSLGWRRLVEPFEPTWRDNWVEREEGKTSLDLEEALEDAA